MVHCARLLVWSRVFKQALSVHHDHDQSINWSHHHVPSTHTHYHQYPSRSLYWGVLVKTLHWPCLSLSPIARTFRCLSSLKRPTGWLRGRSGTPLWNNAEVELINETPVYIKAIYNLIRGRMTTTNNWVWRLCLSARVISEWHATQNGWAAKNLSLNTLACLWSWRGWVLPA